MAWLVKSAKKYAKKAVSRASSSAWKSVKKAAKPKKLSKSEAVELDAWRFWGRSLGSLTKRLQGAKPRASSSLPSVASTKKKAPSLAPKPTTKGAKSPARRRKKGERAPLDPRFIRQEEKRFRIENDYLFNVNPRY